MMNNMTIKPVEGVLQRMDANRAVDRNTPSDPTSFGQWLSKSIASVNQLQQEGDEAAMKLVSGQSKDIHGTMIAMQKATISMDLLLEVRNKIISAYDEIKRMQF
jgi:flagellar hook-basal body complex protein FliE